MAQAGTSHRVEQLLARAKDDPAMLEDLVVRRSRAALEHGFELTSSEQAMLDAVPEAQLRDTIDRLGRLAIAYDTAPAVCGGIRPDEPPSPNQRSSVVRGHSSCLRVAAVTSAVVLTGGAIAATCLTAGARADLPPEPDRGASSTEPASPPERTSR